MNILQEQRMFDNMRARSRMTLDADNKAVLGAYARRARNCGWSWAEIGDAMRISASSARWRALNWREDDE